MGPLALAIDQGTTGTTALVIDRKLAVKAKVNLEFRQIFPRPGWVEHDLEDVWASVVKAVGRALREARVKGAAIAAIGITNQRETTALWERRRGRPVHRAIVWQDRRTADACAALRAAGEEERIRSRTGLVLDPYFSGTKLRWLLDHVKGARERAEAGELAFGTIDTFLAWRLTGGAAHVTDASNASRTLLMDLASLSWDRELLDLLGVPAAVLPRICGSSEVVGTTRGVPGLPDGIPVAGIAGDQQAALFGQACFAPGEAKCTYGTGAFILQNTGARPVPSRNGLLTTVAWRIGPETCYALEGSSFIAGAAVQWLRDGLGIIRRAGDVERLARQVKDSGGVVFVPALAGLGAPHWRPSARGLITGIDRGTTRAHLARATLEGIAFQVQELAEAMRADSGVAIPVFRVDGGATRNGLLLQFQADLLGSPVERPRMIETTALGAAFLAGLATGVWPGRDAIRRAFRVDRRFEPRMAAEEREAHLARWRRAVQLA
ncbi:MAG TPA: glycerol kinase GlpK [Anaeromyxobacteraceae bacterium]|nr:glycerol kinase GlpK [Anaeromyxobacteraceae bacterium]